MFHFRGKRKQSTDSSPRPMHAERRYSLRRVPSQLSSMIKSIDFHHHQHDSSDTDSRTSRRRSLTKSTLAKISASTEQRLSKLMRHTRRGSHQQQHQQGSSSSATPLASSDPSIQWKRASWSPFGNGRRVSLHIEDVATGDGVHASPPRLPPPPPPPLEYPSSLLDVARIPGSAAATTTNSSSSSNSGLHIGDCHNSEQDVSADDGDCAACLAKQRKGNQFRKSTGSNSIHTVHSMDRSPNEHQTLNDAAVEKQQPLTQEVLPTTPLSPRPPAAASAATSSCRELSEIAKDEEEEETALHDEKRQSHGAGVIRAGSVAILQAVSGNDNHAAGSSSASAPADAAAGVLVSPCVNQRLLPSPAESSSCRLARHMVRCIQLADQLESLAPPSREPNVASLVQSSLVNVRAQSHDQRVHTYQALEAQLTQLSSPSSPVDAGAVPLVTSSSWFTYPALWLGRTVGAGSIVSEHAKTGHIAITGTCIANDKEYRDSSSPLLSQFVLLIPRQDRISKFARCPADRWIPDSHAPRCQLPACSTQFTLFQRRHHCRSCGRVVCSRHSANQLVLFDDRDKSEWCRVCDQCFYRLLSLSLSI